MEFLYGTFLHLIKAYQTAGQPITWGVVTQHAVVFVIISLH